MGATAKDRITLGVRGTTSLSPDRVLQLVRSAANEAEGATAGALPARAHAGARIKVLGQSGERVEMALDSARSPFEMATFSADASARSDGRTVVRVGGLETYETTHGKLFGLIPIGPKTVRGMPLYRTYVDLVVTRIRNEDPTAKLGIGQSGG